MAYGFNDDKSKYDLGPLEKKVIFRQVSVNKSLTLDAFSSSNALTGNPPTDAGYTFWRVSGVTNGNVMMCAPNGWILNNSTSRKTITGVRWNYIGIKD